MNRRTRLLLALGLALAAASAGSAQSGDVANPPDPYIHRQTGMAFPARVGPAIRHQIIRYSDDGVDSGVGYQIPRAGEPSNGGIVAYLSVFVYPARPSAANAAAREKACATTFEGIKQDILLREPEARVQLAEAIPAVSGMPTLTGRRIVYQGGTAPFAGTEQKVREEARLFCIPGGKWLVSYRITSPANVNADADVAGVIAALRWPDSFAAAQR